MNPSEEKIQAIREKYIGKCIHVDSASVFSGDDYIVIEDIASYPLGNNNFDIIGHGAFSGDSMALHGPLKAPREYKFAVLGYRRSYFLHFTSSLTAEKRLKTINGYLTSEYSQKSFIIPSEINEWSEKILVRRFFKTMESNNLVKILGFNSPFAYADSVRKIHSKHLDGTIENVIRLHFQQYLDNLFKCLWSIGSQQFEGVRQVFDTLDYYDIDYEMPWRLREEYIKAVLKFS